MTTLAIHREPAEVQAIRLPEPRTPISIRVATSGGDDLKFVDGLQKKHSKMVGFLQLTALEKKIKAGHVSIAEEIHHGNHGTRGNEKDGSGSGLAEPNSHSASSAYSAVNLPVGYCIFQDKYDHHEDCGIFFQVNVVPGKQRGLIGAALVKAALERAAYGCKLACCWCAQDLEANHFWESLGFVPLAFRAGSRPRMKKNGTMSKPGRIHIFWQRRVRQGDAETPYWFPSQTNNGSLGEARIVLPIPPGTHWSDAKPGVLPGFDEKLLCHSRESGNPGDGTGSPPARGRRERKAKVVKPPSRPKRGPWFAPPAPPPLTPEQKKAAKAKERAKRPRFKNDPKLVAAARELRDRYTEQINAGLLLPPSACGKYDVSRQLGPGAAPGVALFPGASDLKLIPLLEQKHAA